MVPTWEQPKIELIGGLNHNPTDFYHAVGWGQPNIEPITKLNI